MPRYGLIVDVKRCIGCYACVVACKSENHTRPGISWISIEIEEKGEFPSVSRTYTPTLCRHCSEMPCAEACPTGAIFRNKTGIVLINDRQCGCGQSKCVEACPYGVIFINTGRKRYFEQEESPEEIALYEAHKDGIAGKCTLCRHRLEDGKRPLCVQTCPTRALLFGDLDDPESEISRLVSGKSNSQRKSDPFQHGSVCYMEL